MMKAIQIVDVNKDLLETWGETEELTWENSFKDIVGTVLVVDDALEQGYTVRTNTQFVQEYEWTRNFGTRGWSLIRRKDEPVSDQKEPNSTVYILWDRSAVRPKIASIHQSFDGAHTKLTNNGGAFTIEPVTVEA